MPELQAQGSVIAIRTLVKRADFLRLRKSESLGGKKYSTTGFLLQMAPKDTSKDGDTNKNDARFGLTVTKKLGNAVVRNRIKRRLRAAIRSTLPLYGRAGYDYVLIGRQAAVDMPFVLLLDDQKRALVSHPEPAQAKK